MNWQIGDNNVQMNFFGPDMADDYLEEDICSGDHCLHDCKWCDDPQEQWCCECGYHTGS